MQIKKLMLGIPIFLCATLLVTTSPTLCQATVDTGKITAAKQGAPVTKGKILGMSKKAKTITIDDKKFGLVMLKFNDETKGLEYAKKGEAAIVKYKVAGNDKIATVIKPKLAKLPKGVNEIMPEELAELIKTKADFMLIDSRPGKRYAAGHIPFAISMPVEKLKKEGKTLLPQDNKDKLLIFYCGGPT